MVKGHLDQERANVRSTKLTAEKHEITTSHNALTADDVRKFAFNFEHYCECITFGTTMSVTLAQR